MQTCVNLLYLAEFFLEWAMIQAKFVEKSKHKFYFQEFPSQKSCRLWYDVEHYGWARQTAHDNTIRRIHFTCWITKATNALRTFNASCSFTRTCLNVLFTRTLPVLLNYYTNRCTYIKFIKFTHQNIKKLKMLRHISVLGPSSGSHIVLAKVTL